MNRDKMKLELIFSQNNNRYLHKLWLAEQKDCPVINRKVYK